MLPWVVTLGGELLRIKNFVRNVFAHETLEEAPLAVAAPDRTRRMAAVLFQREPLAEDPVAPPRPRNPHGLGALLAAEPLAEDPPAPPRVR